MSSRVFNDPHAGEAQWVLTVAADCMPLTTDLTHWYLHVAIPALGGFTPEQLLRRGEAVALVRHLQASASDTPDPGD